MRQLIDGRLMSQDRSPLDAPRPKAPQRGGHVPIAPGALPKNGWVYFQLDQVPNCLQRISKQKPRAFDGAEKIADHREPAPLDAGVIDRRSTSPEDSAVDLRRFQIWIDLLLKTD
jgi:hypothetical protein